MHFIYFENEHDRQLYQQGFQDALHAAGGHLALQCKRGIDMSAGINRVVLGCFNSTSLAKPVPDNPCALRFESLEEWDIGSDKRGAYYAEKRANCPPPGVYPFEFDDLDDE